MKKMFSFMLLFICLTINLSAEMSDTDKERAYPILGSIYAIHNQMVIDYKEVMIKLPQPVNIGKIYGNAVIQGGDYDAIKYIIRNDAPLKTYVVQTEANWTWTFTERPDKSYLLKLQMPNKPVLTCIVTILK